MELAYENPVCAFLNSFQPKFRVSVLELKPFSNGQHTKDTRGIRFGNPIRLLSGRDTL